MKGSIAFMKQTVMCTITVLAIIIGGGNGAHAQEWDHEYVPFVEEGKVWNYVLHYVTQDFQFMTCESQTWIDGDTIIDGRTCYRVCTTDCYESGAERSVRYMYEEEGRVYQMASHSAIILYDFSLDETTGLTDDILHSGWCPEDCQVSKTDTVFVKGHYRKRIHFSWADWCWVEGIGSTANLNQPFGNPVSDGKRYEFVSCYMDGECLFEKDDFYAPGVTDGIQKYERAVHQEGEIYDLQGRRLQAEPAKGLYIRGGKKYLVR